MATRKLLLFSLLAKPNCFPHGTIITVVRFFRASHRKGCQTFFGGGYLMVYCYGFSVFSYCLNFPFFYSTTGLYNR